MHYAYCQQNDSTDFASTHIALSISVVCITLNKHDPRIDSDRSFIRHLQTLQFCPSFLCPALSCSVIWALQFKFITACYKKHSLAKFLDQERTARRLKIRHRQIIVPRDSLTKFGSQNLSMTSFPFWWASLSAAAFFRLPDRPIKES